MPKTLQKVCFTLVVTILLFLGACSSTSYPKDRPNFLFIISDDQSWAHTSKAGYPLVSTPHFDLLADTGLYFQKAFAAAPSCTPSRSAILSGQEFWQLESGAILLGDYPKPMVSYQSLLEDAGYKVGFTGKAWGPGRIASGIRAPGGPDYNRYISEEGDFKGEVDLVANFADFLKSLSKDQPFSFWIGATDPHRPYLMRENRFLGQDNTKVIPEFLPKTENVELQLSAYLAEIEHFDLDLGQILELLKQSGRFDNTVIVVTSDNGMPFSRAKTQNYTWGVQIPLAIYWSNLENKGIEVVDFVQLSDIAPTFLELAGLEIPASMSGQSLAPYFFATERDRLAEQERDIAFAGFERHAANIRGGEQNLNYPRRAVYTTDFVYIRNYVPERWPAGDPPNYGEAYSYLLVDKSGTGLEPFFSLATSKRPAEELYDLRVDPDQMVNVAANADYAEVLETLRNRLLAKQQATQDPILEDVDYFQQFPSYP
ncbi:MAG: sulfatase [Trueperaceae bacterium]|nr:sulfatase [Trueperaceae bacterium]